MATIQTPERGRVTEEGLEITPEEDLQRAGPHQKGIGEPPTPLYLLLCG